MPFNQISTFLGSLKPLNLADVMIMKLPVERWQEFRDLRLEALKLEPQVYGSSFEEKKNEPDQYWQERLQNAVLVNSDYSLLFADYHGVIIGMVGAIIDFDTAKIVHYFIKKEYRHKGVGRKLLEQLINLVKTNPVVKKFQLDINAHETHTIDSFKLYGFHVNQEFSYRMGDGKDHDALVMVKENV
jgi:ribosomal protein S18 acetylase RimI-like enzyme